MMSYSDALEPVYIGGYASVFNRVYDIGGGVLESVAPGAFDLSGSIFATADHEHDRCFGRTECGTLELWQDQVGLAFRLTTQASWGTVNLLRSISAGNLRAASVCFSERRAEQSIAGGVAHDRVIHARITELSLTARAACTETAVWHSGEDPEALPQPIAQARLRWRVGQMTARLSKHRRQARRAAACARPSAALLAAIDATLAMPRPGWQGRGRCGRDWRSGLRSWALQRGPNASLAPT